MLVLHGLWKVGGPFFVWGESSEAKQAPFDAPHGELAKVVPDGQPGDLELTLPTGELGPVASTPLLGRNGHAGNGHAVDIEVDDGTEVEGPPADPDAEPDDDGNGEMDDEPVTMRPWRVRGLALTPYNAVVWLSRLNGQAPADLRFWATAARLVLEFVSTHHFIPSFEPEGDKVRIRWRPALEDRERISDLAAVMPGVCRAAEPNRGPTQILDDFIREAVDGIVHASLDEELTGEEASLLRRAAIELPDARRKQLIEQFRRWSEPVLIPPGAAPWRTLLKLQEPAGPGRPWIVTFHVVASDDPTLIVPAGTVWRAPHQVPKRNENPQHRLLADLGKAGTLFPPIDKALRTRNPEWAWLTPADSHKFMREAAPLLEECGFKVELPPWWKGNTGAPPSIMMRVEAAPTVKATFLGLATLVKFDWQVAIGGHVISKEEFEQIAAMKQPLVQLRGQWVELQPALIESTMKALQIMQLKPLTLGEALSLEQIGGMPVRGVEAVGWIRDMLDAVQHTGERIVPVPVPEKFRGELRPYQKRGLDWLAFLSKWGLGACLADDMGLGKTIQFIALVLHEKDRPWLVVCPTSVIGNWEREIRRFAPSLKTLVHHGASRGETIRTDVDIVITSYSLLPRDTEALRAVEWVGIALDEAQNIKNPETGHARAARMLKAKRRLALTGTPVENRLSELWSIMDFLNPGLVGRAPEFKRRFAIPIERFRDQEASERLKTLITPFVLRRVKTDKSIIQDLPEKMEMKVFCTLTPEQAALYKSVVEESMKKIEGADGIARKGHVLAALTKLKQVCNHPAQFLGDGSALEGRSGKLQRIVEMLDEALSEGDRALVFTQFAEMGRMLHDYLQKELERPVLYLHGGTPRKTRDQMVASFQGEDGPGVFVLSLKAGGFGLNLTGANRVFHFDRWWNPAVENQATDRAFRIGQSRSVAVHKFLCAGTVEEKIDEMIESKKELANLVLGAGEGWITELSTSQLRDLFALKQDAVAEPAVAGKGKS
jgi:superfamily II DNA or RNA helicase